MMIFVHDFHNQFQKAWRPNLPRHEININIIRVQPNVKNYKHQLQLVINNAIVWVDCTAIVWEKE